MTESKQYRLICLRPDAVPPARNKIQSALHFKVAQCYRARDLVCKLSFHLSLGNSRIYRVDPGPFEITRFTALRVSIDCYESCFLHAT
jgi:hypothetical protein